MGLFRYRALQATSQGNEGLTKLKARLKGRAPPDGCDSDVAAETQRIFDGGAELSACTVHLTCTAPSTRCGCRAGRAT